MSRAHHSKPSVNAGYGYKANVSSGKVTIYPTLNGGDCGIKLGLGDATFTFNPKRPPDIIKRLLTKDADGTYTPQIVSTPARCVKLFDSISTVNETFTDADGKTTAVTMPKVIGYKEDAFTAGNYIAQGVNVIDGVAGRTTDANTANPLVFSGNIPFNIQINSIQLAQLRGRYAYIDSDGYVNLVSKYSRKVVKFNMGKGVSDDFVTEFTVKRDNNTFICRNADNIAVEVYAPFSYGTFYKNSGVYKQNIIRVAGGTMLEQDKVGVIMKSVLIDDGTAIPLGKDDVIDIMANGDGGVSEIKTSNQKSNILKKIRGYTLDNNNKLYYNGVAIANEIYGLGKTTQDHLKGISLGKAGNTSNAIKNSAINVFSNANVLQSWKDEYLNWYSKQTLPSCEWIGVAENNSTTSSSLSCVTTSYNSNSGIGYAIVAIDANGKVFRLNGSNLIEQITITADANGFKTLYEQNISGKLITFEKGNGSKKFRMPDIETSYSDQTEFFKF